MKIKWLPIIALIATPTYATNDRVDALTVTIETADAHRFAKLFRESGGKPSAEQLQKHYLDGSGRGVNVFTPYRIENAKNLATSVAAEPDRYRYAIETCLPVIDNLNGELRAVYLAYQGLLPERALPTIHIVFGAGNSGGTAEPDAQVIGLEVMCGPGTSIETFRETMRGLFAHETVHSWQSNDFDPAIANADPLLLRAMREGVADYLASLATGKVPGADRNIWAQAREAWLWQEFEKDRTIVKAGKKGDWDIDEKASKAMGRWIGNYQNAPEGWPHEVGYWVGMKICAAYVEKATDKRAAIKELIELKDPVAILQASGYKGGV
jgi:hypothetical protein